MNRFAEATWPPTTSGREPSSGLLVPVAIVGLVGLATAIAAIVGNGSLVLTLAPAGGAALLFAVSLAPLRTSLLVLMFLGLASDKPGDAEDLWLSPFSFVGRALFHNLNQTVPIDALRFNGVTLALVVLFGVRAFRVLLLARTRDTRESIVAAPPLVWAMGLSAATIVLWLAYGAATGGNILDAKVQVQVILPLLAVAYLFGTSLRGPRDFAAIGRVVVAAAMAKALMALWVTYRVPSGFFDANGRWWEREFATSHGDSLLFTCAVVILIAPFFIRATRRHLRWLLLIMPLIAAGIVANDRRVAWAEIGLSVMALLVMNLRTRSTRSLIRSAVWVSPLLALYVTVGWMSPSRVFKPVQIVRSMLTPERTDGSIDRSTLFRDVENYNLVYTFRQNPLFGSGFGHQFQQAAQNDDLSAFREYLYLPHNSMLGLLAFMGVVGFAGLFGVFIVALYCLFRSYRYAETTDYRLAACVAVSSILAYIVHVWADIGFTEPHTVFLVGAALAVAGQAPTATGAWPSSQWQTNSRA